MALDIDLSGFDTVLLFKGIDPSYLSFMTMTDLEKLNVMSNTPDSSPQPATIEVPTTDSLSAMASMGNTSPLDVDAEVNPFDVEVNPFDVSSDDDGTFFDPLAQPEETVSSVPQTSVPQQKTFGKTQPVPPPPGQQQPPKQRLATVRRTLPSQPSAQSSNTFGNTQPAPGQEPAQQSAPPSSDSGQKRKNNKERKLITPKPLPKTQDQSAPPSAQAPAQPSSQSSDSASKRKNRNRNKKKDKKEHKLITAKPLQDAPVQGEPVQGEPVPFDDDDVPVAQASFDDDDIPVASASSILTEPSETIVSPYGEISVASTGQVPSNPVPMGMAPMQPMGMTPVTPMPGMTPMAPMGVGPVAPLTPMLPMQPMGMTRPMIQPMARPMTPMGVGPVAPIGMTPMGMTPVAPLTPMTPILPTMNQITPIPVVPAQPAQPVQPVPSPYDSSAFPPPQPQPQRQRLMQRPMKRQPAHPATQPQQQQSRQRQNQGQQQQNQEQNQGKKGKKQKQGQQSQPQQSQKQLEKQMQKQMQQRYMEILNNKPSTPLADMEDNEYKEYIRILNSVLFKTKEQNQHITMTANMYPYRKKGDIDVIKVHGLYAASHAFANADLYGKFVGVEEYLTTLIDGMNLLHPYDSDIANINYIISAIPDSSNEQIVLCSITLFDELRDVKFDEEIMPLPYGFVVKVRYYRVKANEFVEDIRLIGAKIANPDIGLTEEDIIRSKAYLENTIRDYEGCIWWTDYSGQPHTVREWMDIFVEHAKKNERNINMLSKIDMEKMLERANM